MSPELVFSIANATALVSWLLLAALPGRSWVSDTVTGKAVPLIFAVMYAAIVVTTLRGSAGSFSSLAGVAQLFANPWLLLAGWLHYLAFDLLIGTWEVRDSRQRGMSHLLLLPCLLLTFMLGPAGWLLYMAVRKTRLKAAQ